MGSIGGASLPGSASVVRHFDAGDLGLSAKDMTTAVTYTGNVLGVKGLREFQVILTKTVSGTVSAAGDGDVVVETLLDDKSVIQSHTILAGVATGATGTEWITFGANAAPAASTSTVSTTQYYQVVNALRVKWNQAVKLETTGSGTISLQLLART